MLTLLRKTINDPAAAFIAVCSISLVFMLSASASAGAQETATSTGTVNYSQTLSRQNQKRRPAQAQTERKSPARGEQAEEEGAVMIDDKTDEESSGSFSDNEPGAPEEREAPSVRGGLPASYGQLKGTLNDGGLNLLVFENEDGVISFVQLFAGKSSVTWKLLSRIYRSAD